MAIAEIADLEAYLRLLPAMKKAPEGSLWLLYDEEADVMYVNFRKPASATDSELTDDDIVIRYAGDEIIGFTILHASRR